MDVGIDSIRVLHQFKDNNTYPRTDLNIRVYFGHDDDPYESNFPVTMQDEMIINISVDNGHGIIDRMSKPVISLALDQYIGNNSTRYNPAFVEFTWQAPAYPPSGSDWEDVFYNLTAELVIDDDDPYDNIMTGDPFQVSCSISNPLLLWEDTMQRLDEMIWEVSVGDTFFLPFLIVNPCPNIDRLKLSILEKPEGWNTISPTEANIYYPFENISVNLLIQTPKDPSLMMSLDHHHFYIIKLSINSTLIEDGYIYPTNNIYELKFTVEKDPHCQIEPEYEQVMVKPGEKNNIRFILDNTGNCPDSYTITAELDDKLIEKGWNAVVMVYDTTLHNIEPFHEYEIHTTLYVPRDAPKFASANLRITARSLTSGENFTSDSCSLFADTIYGAKLEKMEGEITAYPGRWTSFKINYTNTGNDMANDVELNVTAKPENWTVMIDDPSIYRNGGLHPDETCSVTVMIHIGRSCLPSSISLEYFIRIGAVLGPSDQILDEAQYDIHVPLVMNFSIDCSDPDLFAGPGDRINYTVEVRNEGNWLDPCFIEPPFEWMYVEQEPEDLEPNETRIYCICGKVPIDMNADHDPSTPYPDENGMFDPHPSRIGVRSRNEKILNSSYACANVTLRIEPFFSFEMNFEAPQPLLLPVSFDQFRRIPVLIKNTGNVFNDIHLGHKDASFPGWIRWETSGISIPMNSSAFAYLIINYPAGLYPEATLAHFIVTGTSFMDTTFPDGCTIDIGLDIDLREVLFSISETSVRDVMTGPDDTYYLSYGKNYTIDVNIDLLGTKMFSNPWIEYFDLVLYNSGSE
ncbi:MAG: NEW3 domain-containing protein, partial [Candidatus Thermoplasmatota archaeon]|nr:NEW3 domain-containing protein [Candidatus Thermoplasmatota archaeon]